MKRFRKPNGVFRLRECLFWLCALWSVSQMLLILLEFLNTPVRLPSMMPVYSFVLVSLYAAVKEGARWAHKRLGKKKGQHFFYAWWLFALILFLISALSGSRFTVPNATLANCVAMSVIYVASLISKVTHSIYRMNIRLERKSPNGNVSKP